MGKRTKKRVNYNDDLTELQWTKIVDGGKDIHEEIERQKERKKQKLQNKSKEAKRVGRRKGKRSHRNTSDDESEFKHSEDYSDFGRLSRIFLCFF